MSSSIIFFRYCFSLFSYGYFITSFGPTLSSLMKDFSIDESSGGLIYSMHALGVLLSSLIAGILVDKKGTWGVAVLGSFFLTGGSLLFALSSTYNLALIAFFVTGIGGGFIQIAANPAVSKLYPTRSSSMLTFLHAIFGVGALVGPIVGGFILELKDWRYVYFIFAAIGSLDFILGLFIREPLSSTSFQAQQTFFEIIRELSVSYKKIILKPITVIFGFFILLYIGAEVGVNSWSVVFIERGLTFSKQHAGLCLSLFWIGVTLGRVACYFLAESFIKTETLLVVLACGGAISISVFVNAPANVAIGAFGFAGLFFSGIFPLFMSLATSAFPKNMGAITGVVLIFSGSGLLGFPYLIGLISAQVNITSSIKILMFTSIAFATLSFMVRKMYRSLQVTN